MAGNDWLFGTLVLWGVQGGEPPCVILARFLWPVTSIFRSGSPHREDRQELSSTHRLVAPLRARHPWLGEYFAWSGWKVEFRQPVPRFALRFEDQVAFFREQLPGHVLMIAKGSFWQMLRSTDGQALPAELAGLNGLKIRRSSLGSEFGRRLWQSGVAVAWIGETGRRLGGIAERALVCRWTGDPGASVARATRCRGKSPPC